VPTRTPRIPALQSADAIAQHLGIPRDSLISAQAGVRHTLQVWSEQGHCAAPPEKLVAMAIKLLEIPAPIIEEAINVELQHLLNPDAEARVQGQTGAVGPDPLSPRCRQVAWPPKGGWRQVSPERDRRCRDSVVGAAARRRSAADGLDWMD